MRKLKKVDFNISFKIETDIFDDSIKGLGQRIYNGRYSFNISNELGELIIKKFVSDSDIKEIERIICKDYELEMLKNKHKPDKIPSIIKTSDRGYLYLIKSGDFYKIGVSGSKNDRIKSHQTSSPYVIEVIRNKRVENYKYHEKNLMELFANEKIRGEWFDLSQESVDKIVVYIDKLS